MKPTMAVLTYKGQGFTNPVKSFYAGDNPQILDGVAKAFRLYVNDTFFTTGLPAKRESAAALAASAKASTGKPKR